MSSKMQPSQKPVSLPSIDDLLPEHLFSRKVPQNSTKEHSRPYHGGHLNDILGNQTASQKYPSRAPQTYAQTRPTEHTMHNARSTNPPDWSYHRRIDDESCSPPFNSSPRSMGGSRTMERSNDPSNLPRSPVRASHVPTSTLSNARGNEYKTYSEQGYVPLELRAMPSVDSAHASWTSSGSGPSISRHILDDSERLTDDEIPLSNGPSGIPRKHVCSVCGKAFNRPSSLKIHSNTHTGATPFRCPWPKCGREFNVNSNMRRHLRNHSTGANVQAQEEGSRRRRRRSGSGLINTPPELMQQALDDNPHNVRNYGALPATASAHRGYNSYDSYNSINNKQRIDIDGSRYREDSRPPLRTNTWSPVEETEHYDHRGTSRSSTRPYPYPPPLEKPHHHRYPSPPFSNAMLIRALTPGSSFHSSSPSPSPSPSPSIGSFSPPSSTLTSPSHSPAVLPHSHLNDHRQQYHYNPSLPHLRTARDSRVSTALRPAFN